MIVDVDSHWEVDRYADEGHPLEPWIDRIPRPFDRLAHGVAGDLLDALEPDQRPSTSELLAALIARAPENGGKPVLHPIHTSTVAERVGWMDQVGIDHCLVNPGGYWQQLDKLGADRPAAIARCNDFLADQLGDGVDRLHQVAIIELSDLGAAVRELERVRALGARAFFLYTVAGRPPTDVSPGHPDWDIVWSAAVDLGMVAVIHVGNTSTDFTGWADIGWNQPGAGGAPALARLANTQRVHAAQNLLSAMLYGGVFARHPELTVMIEEMRVGWLPHYVQTIERQARSSPVLGEWPWPTSGGDMIRRNVRFTPLPGFGDTDALDVLAALPGMGVFSSDYPHQEGNADPIELYRPELDELDDELRTAFMGANMAEVFERMGDPLLVI